MLESYFPTCVSGQRANDRAGSDVKLWLPNKIMAVRLSLLINHFSHFGVYLGDTSQDEVLIIVAVASSTVDIFDVIPDTVCVEMIKLIRISRSRTDVMVKYAVGLKVVWWGIFTNMKVVTMLILSSPVAQQVVVMTTFGFHLVYIPFHY